MRTNEFQFWMGMAMAVLVLLLALFTSFIFGDLADAQGGAVALDNPGMEAPYVPFEGIGELKVPAGWRPWWNGRRPEYLSHPTSSLTNPDGSVPIPGEFSQKVFTTYSAQDAGIYQEIAVTPGQWYRLTAWVYMQSTGNSGGSSAMACINPWARWDIEHRTTVCGREDVARYNRWTQIEVTAQAYTNKITVATRGIAQWGVRWNDFFWDDATLEQVTIGACPTPAPWTPVVPVPTGVPGDCASIAQIEALLRGMRWGVQ